MSVKYYNPTYIVRQVSFKANFLAPEKRLLELNFSVCFGSNYA